MPVNPDWQSRPLGNVATLQRGFDLPYRLRKLGPYPIATSSGVEDFHNEAKVKGPGVVTGRYGTIGQVFFIPGPFWPLNTTLYVKDFHGNDPGFVAYLLRAFDFKEHSAKTGVPGVNRNDLHRVEVSLPSDRKEQERIAEALSDADALIESLEQLLAKKRQIKQGAMQELLTGAKRLPGFTCKWVEAPLGELARIKTGERNNEDRVDDGEYPFFVRSATVERINTYSYDCEAILVPGEGGIGSIFHYVNGRFEVHQRVYAITDFSPEVSGKFLYFNMAVNFGAHAMHNSVKATVDSLRLPTFKNFLISLPPTKDEQDAIAALLTDFQSEMAAVGQKLSKARQLKQGMMQELLTGRIRLVQRAAEVITLPVADLHAAKQARAHNQQINEAVVIAVLAHRFGSDQYPLGRKRRTKLAYLLHRHSEGVAEGFQKKAAGPYNPEIRYGGAEKIALKNKYVQARKSAKGEGFVAAENIAQALQYFEKWYGADALSWLEQFHYETNDNLELITTVDMAAEELRREGRDVDVSKVKKVIRENPEWVPKLSRALFSDANIASAIESCNRIFPQ